MGDFEGEVEWASAWADSASVESRRGEGRRWIQLRRLFRH